MPMTKADDGSLINVEIAGKRQRAGADAGELSRHQPQPCGTTRSANGPSISASSATTAGPRPAPAHRKGPYSMERFGSAT